MVGFVVPSENLPQKGRWARSQETWVLCSLDEAYSFWASISSSVKHVDFTLILKSLPDVSSLCSSLILHPEPPQSVIYVMARQQIRGALKAG